MIRPFVRTRAADVVAGDRLVNESGTVRTVERVIRRRNGKIGLVCQNPYAARTKRDYSPDYHLDRLPREGEEPKRPRPLTGRPYAVDGEGRPYDLGTGEPLDL